jgi:hypothetical protein
VRVLQVKGINSRRNRQNASIRTGKLIDESALEMHFRMNAEQNKRVHNDSLIKINPSETINLIF